MSEGPRQILEERARALARLKGERVALESMVLFTRAGALFAVHASEVLGSGRLRTLSPAPGAPDWLRGAILHQGEVLTLVDLPAFWNADLPGVVDLRTYVVLSDGIQRVGLLVEELLGLRELDEAPHAPEGPTRVGIIQVTRHQGTLAEVLGARALFDDPRLKA